MQIEFMEDYLLELYEQGKTKNKKHRFQPQVIRKYKQKIDILKAVSRVEDLFVMNSMNYEVLTNFNGRQSVRVDGKFRIEFYTSTEGQEPDTITICSIAELSNHYQ
ncbi:type II toxin-antitoxin system RelE/ParE family toxin [Kaistella pullorum]|uniref:Type II toxin-antitoxin system RelE/ParE family toxin n=1 Tax=Kaistella pullorum TaxID=2763074 RepID=A0ABR8WPV4_9FLAO|nr:type II toxin-antitoxin system RelE/ParE family toxin [Kaistella pullorum]MBD8019090.1 type II toxin-antitoxin system RelE/ParE family toxin [Kaistella pullorum]